MCMFVKLIAANVNTFPYLVAIVASFPDDHQALAVKSHGRNKRSSGEDLLILRSVDYINALQRRQLSYG